MTGLHRDRVIPATSRDAHPSRRVYSLLRKIRLFVLLGLGAILSNSYLTVAKTKQIYAGPLKQGCVPFLNCHACPTAYMACPVGMLQHFTGVLQVPLSLIGFLGAVGMVFGRAACGWLCPFGWIQDTLFKIRTRKFRLPPFLRYGKYLSLVVLAILLPALTEVHWFSRICPWGTLMAGIPWLLWNPVDPLAAMPVIEPDMVGWLYVLKLGVLALFLVLFVLIKRPFCRTTCPLGAIYSLFNRASFMRMEVEGDCVDCDLCVDVCPVDIKISDDPNAADCIRCLKCTVCKNVYVRWGISNAPGSITSPAAHPQG
jgi:ferredoxin-type protein NapH